MQPQSVSGDGLEPRSGTLRRTPAGAVIDLRHDFHPDESQPLEAEARGQAERACRQPPALGRAPDPVAGIGTVMDPVALAQSRAAEQPAIGSVVDREREKLSIRPARSAGVDARLRIGQGVGGMTPGQPSAEAIAGLVYRFEQAFGIVRAPGAQRDQAIA